MPKLHKKLKQAIRGRSKPRYYATLGRADGIVDVPGLENWVYARINGRGPALVVANFRVQSVYGQPVHLGEDDSNPGVLQVLDIAIRQGSIYLPGSRTQKHGWSHLHGGADPAYIDTQQIINNLLTPTTGLLCKLYPGWVTTASGVLIQALGEIVNFTTHVPSTSGKARWVLCAIDTSGATQLTNGSEVNIEDLAPSHAPTIPAGQTGIAFVKLVYGQTTISDSYSAPDIVDVRWLLRIIDVLLHKTTHENGGTDEISVAGLSGKLADLQDAGWIDGTQADIDGTPADNEVLAYNTATSKIINQTAAEASLSEVGHTHVETDITDLDHDAVKIKGVVVNAAPGAGNDGQAIIYDLASNKFIYGDAGGGGGDLYWFVDGVLAAATGVGQTIVAPYDMTISNVLIYVKENGSANTTTVDVNINGTSIFTGAKPTIAHDDPNNWTEQVPDTTAITEDDLITVDIDAIATGAAGLTVCVVVSSGGGGGGGAPTDATYVTEDANGSLSAESVLGTKVITTAAYASRQAAAKAGRLFVPSNGFHLYRDTGAAWAAWGPIYPITVPVDSGFAWVNQVDATLTVEKGGMRFDDPANAGTDWHLYVKSTPAAPYTFTIGMVMLGYGQYCAAGMVVRDSAGNKFIHFTLQWRTAGAGPTLSVCAMNSVSSWNADYATPAYLAQYARGLYWLRIYDNNTTRYYQFSADGQNWMDVYSHARATFITPNQIGYGIASYNSNTAVMMNVISSDI